MAEILPSGIAEDSGKRKSKLWFVMGTVGGIHATTDDPQKSNICHTMCGIDMTIHKASNVDPGVYCVDCMAEVITRKKVGIQ
jgi:hypothetical protein